MSDQKRMDALRAYSHEIHTWGSIGQLLHWDQETYMPPAAIEARSQQIALHAHHVHKLKTSPRMKQLLGHWVDLKTGRIKKRGLSLDERLILREWYKEYWRCTKLPASFVRQFSELTSRASQAWAEAKRNNQFELFAPYLEQIVAMNRKKAEVLEYDEHPYDALLALYEHSISHRRVKKIFGRLKKELAKLLQEIAQAKPVDDSFLQGGFDPEVQMRVGKEILALLPIDPERNRLDVSSHPFSIAPHPNDSRITTRLLDNPMSNLFSVLHEAGHAMYEMGLPLEHWGTPLAEAVSLAAHESQSRWWETRIGRSRPFWQFAYPRLKEAFPDHFRKVSFDQFYRAIHKVEPSLIRVEADEVTYGLHVILRFEIEEALIEGKLSVADVPAAWNAQMQELLGVTPPNDTLGCLQDIHWSLGDMGYFPTYTLGNLMAAQLFETFEKKFPQWEKRVAKGDLAFIRDWLQKEVHQHGRRYNADELVRRITGKPLSEKAYVKYLRDKYRALYQLT